MFLDMRYNIQISKDFLEERVWDKVKSKLSDKKVAPIPAPNLNKGGIKIKEF